MSWVVIKLLFVAVTLKTTCHGHNIETRSHTIVAPNSVGTVSQFGSTIAAFKVNGNTKLLVGAPSSGLPDENRVRPGELYYCEVSPSELGSVQCASKYGFGFTGAIGLSLTMPESMDEFVVCGNRYTKLCPGANIEQRSTGACYRYLTSGTLLLNPASSECGNTATSGLDIVLVVDGSGSIGPDDFQKALFWIVDVLAGYKAQITSGIVRVGFVQFSTAVENEFVLDHYTYDVLQGKILSVKWNKGGTNTHLGIRSGRIMFRNYGRADSTRITIVITDGQSDFDSKTFSQANQARNDGIKMVAVGVSNYVLSELQGIADTNAMVLFADNFDNLAGIVGKLQNVINETAQGNLEGTDGNTTNEFSQCQLGFSAHYSKNSTLFVGAVGAFDRAGSMASYERSSNDYIGLLSSAGLGEVVNATSLRESYAGYSVSSGKFFGVSGGEFVVSGTPRYESRGTVLIMSSPDLADPTFSLHPHGQMWQLGAYFGQAVLGADLNKDGWDDLMVSAPLYSHQAGYDQGRVFVFMNDPKNPGPESWTSLSYQPLILYGSTTSGGRFGSTMEVAGDLDNNGYTDVIIGAPLEESTSQNSGVVYVYYLSSDGISDAHRQRIVGSVIHSPLSRFGASVATSNRMGHDVNNDGYPDVMVGSPSSNSVLVLRSRAIIDVTSSMTLSPGEIDVIDCVMRPGGLCSTAKFCMSAVYRVNPDAEKFPFQVTANLDSRISNSLSKRLLIFGKDTHLQTNATFMVGAVETCIDFQMFLNIRGFGKLGDGVGGFDVTPTINVTYQLTPAHQAESFSPVLDRFQLPYVTSDWEFQTGCNGTCDHDLSATATYSLDSSVEELILTDLNGIVSVTISIRNAGPDYSYFTKINITSGSLPRSKVTGDCVRLSAVDSTAGFTVLEYVAVNAPLEDIMANGAECNFIIEFDLGSLADKAVADEIEITGVVYSNAGRKSAEINTENNKFRFQRLVAYSASLFYGSSASPDEFFFNRTMPLDSTITSLLDPVLGGSLTNVQHTHVITSNGPLMIAVAPMKFTWPGALDFLPLFYLYQFSCEPAYFCTCDTAGKINSLQLSLDNKTKGATVKLEYPQPDSVNLPLDLTCDDVTCGTIMCTIQNMTSHSKVVVTASFKVWLPTLTRPNLHTKMFSDITVDTTALPVDPAGQIFTKRATTTIREFVPPETESREDQGSNIGAIIGGVLGGIALLCIIVLVLWKAGFFKSKYGERTREAREMEGNNEAAPYEVAE